MIKVKRPHKSIRIFNLLLAMLIMTFLVFIPASAFADAEVKLNVTGKTLVRSKTYTLKVYNLSENQKVVFKSENPDIAVVNSNGVVTAVSNGTTLISVYIYDSDKLINTLSCDIIVGSPAISVRITKSEITLEQGKKTLLKTILLPYNTAEEVKFCVIDPTIASVSAGGQITAKAVGETYAFALIDNGKFDFCKINVTEASSEDTPSSEAQDTVEITDDNLTGEELADEELTDENLTDEKLNELPSVFRALESNLLSEDGDLTNNPLEDAEKSKRLSLFQTLYKFMNESGFFAAHKFFLRDLNPLQQPFNKTQITID